MRELRSRIKVVFQRICHTSVIMALKEQKLFDWIDTLRQIVPDLSEQESGEKFGSESYWEIKRRGLHSFQCEMMLNFIYMLKRKELLIVDIGDSAGTHMSYIKRITKEPYDIDTISVNLDDRAIKKIRAKNLKAIQKRAEEITPEDIGGKNKKVDLFTSFEMVEHLHDPCIFFKRLAYNNSCNHIILTVPYVKCSRVGLHHVRKNIKKPIYAEDEHVFELNPEDWELVFKHSGWKIILQRVYYQYPKKIPILSQLLGLIWKHIDYQGYWGCVLTKDKTFSDLYLDWSD